MPLTSFKSKIKSTLAEVKGRFTPKEKSPSSDTLLVEVPMIDVFKSPESTRAVTDKEETLTHPIDEINDVPATLPPLQIPSANATPHAQIDESAAFTVKPNLSAGSSLGVAPTVTQTVVEAEAERARAEQEARRRARKEKAKVIAAKMGMWIASVTAHVLLGACIEDAMDF